MENENLAAGSDRRRSCTQNDGDAQAAAPPVPAVAEPSSPLLSGEITATGRLSAMREPNGRFKRGAPSPNPSGRAPVAPAVREAARAYTTDMLAVLVEVAMDAEAPPSARVAAANAVLDRGHGKPVTNLEAKVATVDINAMHLEALRELSRPNA